jgi:hypothetical protein
VGFFATSGILNRKGFFGAQAFSPSSIAGLQLWLDATTGLFDATSGGSVVTTDGSAVARWEDQSGSGYHVTQATLANRPVLKTGIRNSKNAIRFDGSNDALVSANIVASNLSAMTCFVVSYIAGFGGGGFGRYFDRGGITGRTWFVDARDVSGSPANCNTVIIGSTGGAGQQTALNSLSSANWFLSSVRWDGGTSYIANISQKINRVVSSRGEDNSFTLSSVANTTYVIGNRTALDRGFNGDFAELIIYNQALTTEQIDNVEGYLAAKWGF